MQHAREPPGKLNCRYIVVQDVATARRYVDQLGSACFPASDARLPEVKGALKSCISLVVYVASFFVSFTPRRWFMLLG